MKRFWIVICVGGSFASLYGAFECFSTGRYVAGVTFALAIPTFLQLLSWR